MPDNVPPTADDLIEPLACAVRGYYDDLAVVALSHGLSTSRARALIALREPLSMRTLADHLVCDASNATGLIARMEARGLVQKTPAPPCSPLGPPGSTPRPLIARPGVTAAMRQRAVGHLKVERKARCWTAPARSTGAPHR